MRETTSFESIGAQPQTRGKFSLFIVVMGVAHGILFFALGLYLPFDLDELFLLAYGLVIADSGLLAFFGIKLLRRTLFASTVGSTPR